MKSMCYDCGCEIPDDDHGDPRHIVEKDFEEAAAAEGIPADKAKENVASLINKLAGKKKAEENSDEDKERAA